MGQIEQFCAMNFYCYFAHQAYDLITFTKKNSWVLIILTPIYFLILSCESVKKYIVRHIKVRRDETAGIQEGEPPLLYATSH